MALTYESYTPDILQHVVITPVGTDADRVMAANGTGANASNQALLDHDDNEFDYEDIDDGQCQHHKKKSGKRGKFFKSFSRRLKSLGYMNRYHTMASVHGGSNLEWQRSNVGGGGGGGATLPAISASASSNNVARHIRTTTPNPPLPAGPPAVTQVSSTSAEPSGHSNRLAVLSADTTTAGGVDGESNVLDMSKSNPRKKNVVDLVKKLVRIKEREKSRRSSYELDTGLVELLEEDDSAAEDNHSGTGRATEPSTDEDDEAETLRKYLHARDGDLECRVVLVADDRNSSSQQQQKQKKRQRQVNNHQPQPQDDEEHHPLQDTTTKRKKSRSKSPFKKIGRMIKKKLRSQYPPSVIGDKSEQQPSILTDDKGLDLMFANATPANGSSSFVQLPLLRPLEVIRESVTGSGNGGISVFSKQSNGSTPTETSELSSESIEIIPRTDTGDAFECRILASIEEEVEGKGSRKRTNKKQDLPEKLPKSNLVKYPSILLADLQKFNEMMREPSDLTNDRSLIFFQNHIMAAQQQQAQAQQQNVGGGGAAGVLSVASPHPSQAGGQEVRGIPISEDAEKCAKIRKLAENWLENHRQKKRPNNDREEDADDDNEEDDVISRRRNDDDDDDDTSEANDDEEEVEESRSRRRPPTPPKRSSSSGPFAFFYHAHDVHEVSAERSTKKNHKNNMMRSLRLGGSRKNKNNDDTDDDDYVVMDEKKKSSTKSKSSKRNVSSKSSCSSTDASSTHDQPGATITTGGGGGGNNFCLTEVCGGAYENSDPHNRTYNPDNLPCTMELPGGLLGHRLSPTGEICPLTGGLCANHDDDKSTKSRGSQPPLTGIDGSKIEVVDDSSGRLFKRLALSKKKKKDDNDNDSKSHKFRKAFGKWKQKRNNSMKGSESALSMAVEAAKLDRSENSKTPDTSTKDLELEEKKKEDEVTKTAVEPPKSSPRQDKDEQPSDEIDNKSKASERSLKVAKPRSSDLAKAVVQAKFDSSAEKSALLKKKKSTDDDEQEQQQEEPSTITPKPSHNMKNMVGRSIDPLGQVTTLFDDSDEKENDNGAVEVCVANTPKRRFGSRFVKKFRQERRKKGKGSSMSVADPRVIVATTGESTAAPASSPQEEPVLDQEKDCTESVRQEGSDEVLAVKLGNFFTPSGGVLNDPNNVELPLSSNSQDPSQLKEAIDNALLKVDKDLQDCESRLKKAVDNARTDVEDVPASDSMDTNNAENLLQTHAPGWVAGLATCNVLNRPDLQKAGDTNLLQPVNMEHESSFQSLAEHSFCTMESGFTFSQYKLVGEVNVNELASLVSKKSRGRRVADEPGLQTVESADGFEVPLNQCHFFDSDLLQNVDDSELNPCSGVLRNCSINKNDAPTRLKTEIWQAWESELKPFYFATVVPITETVDMRKLRRAAFSNQKNYDKLPEIVRASKCTSEGLTGYSYENMSPLYHSTNIKLYIEESLIQKCSKVIFEFQKAAAEPDNTARPSIMTIKKFQAAAAENPMGMEIQPLIRKTHKMKISSADDGK